MSLTTVEEVNIATATPDRMVMVIKGLSAGRARSLALAAVQEARRKMPKMSGASSSRLQPIWAKGYFGVVWADPYVWFQDHGIQPFTMKNMAGKTIPMWVDDRDGELRKKNPKIKIRTTMSGKTQVLIFRKVAKPGDTKTKTVRNKKTGILENKIVPASYPGAAGRINKREAPQPFTTKGKQGGRIAGGNGGVRWRHPGLAPRQFLNNALTLAAQQGGILPHRVYAADKGWRSSLHMAD